MPMQVPHFQVPRSLFLQDKFWLLRRVSTLLKFAAWFVLGAGLLVAVVGVLLLLARGGGAVVIVQALGYVVTLALLFVYLLSLSEWIQVMLDIEENTRHSTVVLRELVSRMFPQANIPPVGVPASAVPPPSMTRSEGTEAAP